MGSNAEVRLQTPSLGWMRISTIEEVEDCGYEDLGLYIGGILRKSNRKHVAGGEQRYLEIDMSEYIQHSKYVVECSPVMVCRGVEYR